MNDPQTAESSPEQQQRQTEAVEPSQEVEPVTVIRAARSLSERIAQAASTGLLLDPDDPEFADL